MFFVYLQQVHLKLYADNQNFFYTFVMFFFAVVWVEISEKKKKKMKQFYSQIKFSFSVLLFFRIWR